MGGCSRKSTSPGAPTELHLRASTSARLPQLRRTRATRIVRNCFGKSPAVAKSFFAGRETTLASLDADPFTNRSARDEHERPRLTQQEFPSDGESIGQLWRVRARLSRAISRRISYEKIGVKVTAEYQQLKANPSADRDEIQLIRPKGFCTLGEARQGAAAGRSEYVEFALWM